MKFQRNLESRGKLDPMTTQRQARRLQRTTSPLLAGWLALLFGWIYALWIPLHLAMEPHHSWNASAPHSHCHDESEHEDERSSHTHESSSASQETAIHSSDSHEHPSLEVASTLTKTPVVETSVSGSRSSVGALSRERNSVTTSCPYTPKLHYLSQASPRAPPFESSPLFLCG